MLVASQWAQDDRFIFSYLRGKRFLCLVPLLTGKNANICYQSTSGESRKGESSIIHIPPQKQFPNGLALNFQVKAAQNAWVWKAGPMHCIEVGVFLKYDQSLFSLHSVFACRHLSFKFMYIVSWLNPDCLLTSSKAKAGNCWDQRDDSDCCRGVRSWIISSLCEKAADAGCIYSLTVEGLKMGEILGLLTSQSKSQ